MWQQRGDSWCSLCLNHPSRSWTLSRLQKVGRGTPRTGRQSIEGPKQKDKQPRGLTSAEYLESQINITSLFLLFFFFDSSWSAFKNLLWSLCLFTSVEKGLRQRLMVLDQYVHVKQEVAFLPGSGVAQETERVISPLRSLVDRFASWSGLHVKVSLGTTRCWMNAIGQISSKKQRVPVQSPSSNVSGYSKSGAHTILQKDVPLFVDTGTAPIRHSKICSSRLGSGNSKCHRYDSRHTALCRRICICQASIHFLGVSL